MNEIFLSLGIEGWKPLLTALVLPPLPLLLLVLVGMRLVFRRRLLAWTLVLLAVLLLWLSTTTLAARGLSNWLLQPPPPLSGNEITELKRAPKTAIVVLGGGRQLLAPEYGVSMLNQRGMERLHYAIWLSRETGLPLAFSGGLSAGSDPGLTEAEIASRVAERDYGRPLRWIEKDSRDTRENALKSVQLLHAAGIERIVLVTHDYHMRRAMRNFERARAASPGAAQVQLVAAPMGMGAGGRLRWGDWTPSVDGFDGVRLTLREWLGWIVGA